MWVAFLPWRRHRHLDGHIARPTLDSALELPVIQPTMIQASVSHDDNCRQRQSGKNSPQLRLRQGAAEGSEALMLM